ncbi:branched-chain amino acid ABC transporter substrate-binding protein [Terribacillus saccharophilus]|uniref:Branched chain amino acid ABC transporter substrate-binding protein n=1 Tax=Terribacillus saccharophilus TaxID=361277 RepID=A0ABX4GZN3_9BACI|nr:branched-chain amino acid ABC transporter substrate-binding protein [Terribacillus saccharophilus]PAD36257.1 branched chain amino acid ABC transporter substrate-binding protein [Terribacillus saccharophilus]PAD96769.1 branched chain amino acid ABC transporter substrate-binding protein [Terribacillus saccharophilus]PAE00345.1 branched chain amino acid ABC transporter substrate-binding protein [Terribacillus saccharophilus]
MALAMTSTLALGFLAACGNTDSASGGEGSETVKIALQAPMSGGSATLGEAIKNGAVMAVEEEKAAFEEAGFSLELVEYDDQGDPQKGVSNAQIIGSDQDVYGVVAHLNSGVFIPSSEVYERYNIPSVSPASTATDVTDRGLKSVNRIVARDDFQGPAGAEYAVQEIGAKKIFVINDKTAYGQGLATAFAEAAAEEGAEIVGEAGITVGEKDFNGVLNQVSSADPDLVYFGGLYSEGGLLIKQARDNGIDAAFMGGDGLDSSTLVEIAGDTISNVYLTSVAGDSSATEFAKNYEEEYGAKPESFSIYGYDSAKVLMEGILNAVEENGGELPAKDKVAAAVRAIDDYEGEMTQVSFDDKGDNEFAKIFIYKFDEASYPAKIQGEISQ